MPRSPTLFVFSSALVCLVSACRQAGPPPSDVVVVPSAKGAPMAPETRAVPVVSSAPVEPSALVAPVAPEDASFEIGADVPAPKGCPSVSLAKTPSIATMDWLALFDRLAADFPEDGERPTRPSDNRIARDRICFRSPGFSGGAPQLEAASCPLADAVLEVSTQHAFFTDRTYLLWPRGEVVDVFETMTGGYGAGPDRRGEWHRADAKRTKLLVAYVETTIEEAWVAKKGTTRVDAGQARLTVKRVDGDKELVVGDLAPGTKATLRGTSVTLEAAPGATLRKGCQVKFDVP